MSSTPDTASPTDVLVACLCADWCIACREYKSRFEQAQAMFSGARFVWVDIEDQADLVDPVEVENFPTILVTVDGQPRFFGPVLPHIETLERLVRAQITPTDSPALRDPAIVELAQRLQAAPM